MLQRVVSYTDGRVVFYYNDKEITYRKDMEPEVRSIIYNKKGNYGFLERTTGIRSNRNSPSRN